MTDQKIKIPETLSWQTLSGPVHHRSPAWYLGFVLVSIGLMIFAIFSGSIITIITFALIILIVFVLSTQSPRKIQVKITKTGISVGSSFYEYKIIKFFWILYNPSQVKNLKFETTAYINNTISIELTDQDPVMLKMVLSQYIPEDLEKEESISETLTRKLKI